MQKARTLLRVLRAQQEPKLTQRDIADAVAKTLKRGFSMQRYWQIEHGYGAEPSTDEQGAIAAVFGVRVVDIAWPRQEQAGAAHRIGKSERRSVERR